MRGFFNGRVKAKPVCLSPVDFRQAEQLFDDLRYRDFLRPRVKVCQNPVPQDLARH